MAKSKVYVRYNGETPLRVRLESCAEKVEMKKGDVRLAQLENAVNLAGSYKMLELVDAADLTEKEIKEAHSYVVKEKEEREKAAAKVAAANEKAAAEKAKRQEKEKAEESKKEVEEAEKEVSEEEAAIEDLDEELAETPKKAKK